MTDATTMTGHIPSPADAPQYTAAQLLEEMRERGCRIYRMRERAVFVLTNDAECATWLLELGARSYHPKSWEPSFDMPLGAYRKAPEGPPEWDMWIHIIEVKGEETIWEAAGKVAPTVEAVDFA
jgi:hypothetical protein